MFDMSTIAKRYFNVKMGDLTLDVEPPKVSTYKEILRLLEEETPDKYKAMNDALQKAFLSNKQGIKITAKMIDDAYSTDEIKLVLAVYINWIDETKSDPN